MNRAKDFLRSLGRGLVDFFNPRDWMPEFPIPKKRDPDAKGYQTLWEAIQGFRAEDEATERRKR